MAKEGEREGGGLVRMGKDLGPERCVLSGAINNTKQYKNLSECSKFYTCVFVFYLKIAVTISHFVKNTY